VSEHEAFNTHKARAACERYRESARISASEYLNAERLRYRPSKFRADDSHRGNDLRTDAGFQVWAIMRVLSIITPWNPAFWYSRASSMAIEMMVAMSNLLEGVPGKACR
jgi:hypothetical protein